MAAPIGISCGDFILAIKLFKDVGKALREHGGAQADYQRTTQDLKTIHSILNRLDAFSCTAANPETVVQVRHQARIAKELVDAFLHKIKKFDSVLGRDAPTGPHHGTLAKIKWSRGLRCALEELNKNINSCTNNIQMLMQLDHSQSTALVMRQQCETSAQLSMLPTRSEFRAAVATLTRGTQHSTVLVSSDVQNLREEIMQRIDTATETVETAIKDLVEATLGHELGANGLDQVHAAECPTPVTSTNSSLTLTLATPRFQLHFQSASTSIQNLYVKVRLTSLLWFALFLRFLTDLVLAMPYIYLLMTYINRIPQAISLVLHDNMNFEDALGRVHSLQFQQFKHWIVFRTSLRAMFLNLPGVDKVSRGHFVLTPQTRPDVQLTASNYSAFVKPGFNFFMSIMMKRLVVIANQCPKGCKGQVKVISPLESHCTECGLRYTSGPIQVKKLQKKAKIPKQKLLHETHSPASMSSLPTDAGKDEGSQQSATRTRSHTSSPSTMTSDEKPAAEASDDGTGSIDDEESQPAKTQELENQLDEKEREVSELKSFRRIHVERTTPVAEERPSSLVESKSKVPSKSELGMTRARRTPPEIAFNSSERNMEYNWHSKLVDALEYQMKSVRSAKSRLQSGSQESIECEKREHELQSEYNRELNGFKRRGDSSSSHDRSQRYLHNSFYQVTQDHSDTEYPLAGFKQRRRKPVPSYMGYEYTPSVAKPRFYTSPKYSPPQASSSALRVRKPREVQ